jgi:hypothetical protein
MPRKTNTGSVQSMEVAGDRGVVKVHAGEPQDERGAQGGGHGDGIGHHHEHLFRAPLQEADAAHQVYRLALYDTHVPLTAGSRLLGGFHGRDSSME